eukprot:CAMPEP_0118924348 /NCGR_PEP_ID=MMETSP1169-20130426/2523_1 /TAXON_ID=36882 /ORGANISM="Pyramimonas obovata, Strain CCMP722" /LENGTH=295 /DNA_ID=CAMNT_0006865449 /DNA_START=876 /DNA_END=1760 /DNA_ORIENTATION=+
MWCGFIHSKDMCKFGAGCLRPDCMFVHGSVLTPKGAHRAQQGSDHAGSTNTLSTAGNIKRKASQLSSTAVETPGTEAMCDVTSTISSGGARLSCVHFPACHNGPACPYMHPEVPCKYGSECTRGSSCVYLHAFEPGLPIKTILSRLLALLVARNEATDGNSWVELTTLQKIVRRWPMDADGGVHPNFKRAAILEAFNLQGYPPPAHDRLSVFNQPCISSTGKQGTKWVVGFPSTPASKAKAKPNPQRRKKQAKKQRKKQRKEQAELHEAKRARLVGEPSSQQYNDGTMQAEVLPH